MSITSDEYRSRIERLAAVAGAAGLDGVLLTAESNIDYFSGYRHHAPWTLFARPFFEVVSAGGEAVLVGHSFLAPEMERTSAVRDIRAYSKAGGGLDVLLDCLRELGLDRGRLGMEQCSTAASSSAISLPNPSSFPPIGQRSTTRRSTTSKSPTERCSPASPPRAPPTRAKPRTI